MSVTTKNTELIPESELQQIIKYNNQLVITKNNLAELIPIFQQAAVGVDTYSGDYKTLIAMLKDFEKNYKKATTEGDNYRRTITELEKLTQRLAHAQTEEAKAEAQVREQIRRKNQELRNTAKETQAADGSLNQMRATLSRLKAEAANLNIDSDAFKKAAANIDELNTKILTAEASMGDHRRNVGNYSSAFNNLSFQVQQVARELPSLAIGPKMFFLAISNNLPMLKDAYDQAIAKNKELREANAKLAVDQQKQIIPVWKQMLKSVLSWNTGIVVAITLLSKYGDQVIDWVKQLIKGKEAVDATAFATKQLNDAMTRGRVEAVKDVTELELLYKAATDVTRAQEERLAAAERLQELYPDYLGNMSAEKIMAGKTAIEYENLKNRIIAAAKARAYQNQIAENAETVLKIESFEGYEDAKRAYEMYQASRKIMYEVGNAWNEAPSDYNLDSFRSKLAEIIPNLRKELNLTIEEELKLIDETPNKFRRRYRAFADDIAEALGDALPEEYKKDPIGLIAAYNKADEELEKMFNARDALYDPAGGNSSATSRLSDERQAYYENERLILEGELETQEEIWSNEQNSYDDRIAALEKFLATRRALIALDKAKTVEELEAEGLTPTNAPEAYRSVGLIEASAGYEADKEYDNAAMKIAEDEGKRIVEVEKQRITEMKALKDRQQANDLQRLSEQYKKGLLSREEYESEKVRIQREYANEQINGELEALRTLADNENLSAEQRAQVEEALAALEVKLREQTNAWIIKDNEDRRNEELAAETKLEQAKRKLYEETFNLLDSLNDAALERELNRLEELSEANEKWQEEETGRVERLEEQGVISKEQAQARKDAIDQQTAAKEEEIEKQRIEAERRSAIYEKEMAIAKATIYAALALTKVADNPILAAVVAATTAAQIAAIVAQPLPEYAHGTGDHPGGLAKVGDGGRPELVVLPDGSMWKTPAKDTIVDLPEHTQVFPDYDKYIAAFAFPNLPSMPESVQSDPRIDQIVNGMKRTEHVLTTFKTSYERSKVANRYYNITNNPRSKKWN